MDLAWFSMEISLIAISGSVFSFHCSNFSKCWLNLFRFDRGEKVSKILSLYEFHKNRHLDR